MASSKLGNLPMISSPSNWQHMDTTNALQLPVYGDTNGVQYSSSSLWMILVLNMLIRFILNISSQRSTGTPPSPLTTDWTGTKFSGIDITWDYTAQMCQTTMKGYINDVHAQLGHPDPKKTKHSPHLHSKIIYGTKQQYATNDVNTSPPLDEEEQ